MINGLLFPTYYPYHRSTFWFVCFFLAFMGNDVSAVTAPEPAPPPLPSQPRFFFSIDLDPRHQVIGTGALTEEAAAMANCYCFTYFSDGRLQRLEYKRAGLSMPDPFFQAPRVDFEYQTGVERRWYRDADGKPIQNADGVEGEELTLNPAGYPTDIANVDASGARMRDSYGVTHYTRKLDDQGRLILERRIGYFGTEITDHDGNFEGRQAYDSQGRPVENGNFDSSGNPLNANNGVALVRTTYTIYPDSTQIIESYFDASGLAANEKGAGYHELARSLDKRGFLLSESYFDVTGAPTLDTRGIHELRREYDERGNLLSEEFFDTDGKPENLKKGGYARVVYKYDDKNRVSERAYFGDDGTPQIPTNLGAAVIRFEYDDQGTIVREQFFDGKGDPTADAIYHAQAIRIKVDGDTTLISLRNKNDKIMEHPIGGYAALSYKTDRDHPRSPTNRYFDRHGYELSYFPRVSVINPHLHALRDNKVMQYSARYGAAAVGLGGLLAAFLALRKSFHTKRRKVYVPTPLERFLGWFSIFAIFEGTLRFFMTVYWAWVGYQNGRMGHGVYILETIFILFFFYRLARLRVTMRVLNIGRDDLHRLIREFFQKAHLEPEWIESRRSFVTDPLSVRANYFRQKCHAYLAFYHVHSRDLARGFVQYIRSHVGEIQSPPRTRAIALYYPSVAFCYVLLSLTAFYTLWQLLKR